MSAPLPDGTARPRRTRTRSRRVSVQPALAVSSLKVHQYDLDPKCISLICPDCKTWVPIDRFQHTKHRLVPHDTGVARQDKAARCRGSNRLVDIDVDIDTWRLKTAETASTVASRRPNRVTRKPRTAVAPAVSQIAALRQTPAAKPTRTPSWKLRKTQWEKTAPAVRRTDARRAEQPAGAAPLGAPPVPTKTLHPKPHAA
ncbi:hypothetical protein ACFUJ0_10485 [Streptomyces sp. NPDC057242]|uniref:hypothetical protein n=1 Tax=unclassified Streptomyces TaxID=2593676 RepID=UPI00362C2A74